MKILITMGVKEQHEEELKKSAAGAELLFLPADKVLLDELDDAHVIIGNIPPELLPAATNLRWLRLNTAGADAYCKKGVLKDDVLLTNATGAYGLALSEHLLAQLLAMMKKLYSYYDNQKKAIWHDEGQVTSIENATVLILGIGDIGRAFARRVKALGAYVIGVRRRTGSKPVGIDELGTMQNLDSLLARADVVVSVLPASPTISSRQCGPAISRAQRSTSPIPSHCPKVIRSGRHRGSTSRRTSRATTTCPRRKTGSCRSRQETSSPS